MVLPELEWPVVVGGIERFISESTADAGLERAVVGTSGGIDSSVALVLCARALGTGNVLAVSMPGPATTPESAKSASDLAQALAIEFETIDITPQLDAYFARFPAADKRRRGNKAARERMSVLYDRAAATDALVCGTSNRTEWLLGYGTIHGDTASSFNPIGDLHKTEVRRLAAWLDLPASICNRAPSAELWEGQTDEGELGFTYEEVDVLLWAMVDRGMSDAELIEAGFTPGFIQDVKLKIEASAFKRRLAPIYPVH